MTLKERYTRYLTEHGWVVDRSQPKSRLYEKYNHPSRAGWYFIGRHAAIRFNFENKSGTSHSCSFRVKPMMIAWEKKNGYTV
jgi:hypothetical protein